MKAAACNFHAGGNGCEMKLAQAHRFSALCVALERLYPGIVFGYNYLQLQEQVKKRNTRSEQLYV